MLAPRNRRNFEQITSGICNEEKQHKGPLTLSESDKDQRTIRKDKV